MSDASDPQQEWLREFLDAEKSRPDPLPEVQQRTKSRLATTLGLGAGLGNGPASSSPSDRSSAPASAPPGTHSLARVFARGPHRAWATFLVGAAVGATVYGTVARLRQDPKVANPPPATSMVAPPASESTAVAPLPVPELPSAVEAGHQPIVTAPSNGRSPGEPAVGGSKDEGLAAERHLIEMARTALARGRLDGALATLHRHARRFANGQLAEERDSLLVQTLVAKGDYGQARERATRFRRQHPSSLFQPVVDQALQSIP